jgi:hypothetical protein
MLGVFLLGLLTRRQVNMTNIPAMPISTVVYTLLPILIWIGTLHLGWSWLIVIGTGITFIISVTSRRIMAFIK